MRESGRIRSGKKYGIGQKGPSRSVSGGGAFGSAAVHPWVQCGQCHLVLQPGALGFKGPWWGLRAYGMGGSPGWAATLRALGP